jgi:probable F420-dependent oxidoreductase
MSPTDRPANAERAAHSMPTPQLSIQLSNFAAEAPASWDSLLGVAECADRAGMDRVVVSDHIVLGERLDAYADPSTGGTAGGKQPTGPDGCWLEPLTVLSVIAGRTTRVRLGTAVLLAALRPAAVLAKQLATLDQLSAGRLDLGVGVGWQREEYEVVGRNFADRGGDLDECLRLCRQLWTQQVVDGQFGSLRFDHVHAMPKPVQPGGVPIWVSGRATPRTARRVAEYGVGWIPWGDDIAQPEAGIALMRNALSAAGRDPNQLQVQGILPLVRDAGAVDVAASMRAVPRLLASGITDVRVHNRWGADAAADEALMTDLVSAFRAAAT